MSTIIGLVSTFRLPLQRAEFLGEMDEKGRPKPCRSIRKGRQNRTWTARK